MWPWGWERTMSKADSKSGDGGALLGQNAKTLDQFGGPLGEVGKSAFLDLAVLAVGRTREDGGGRVTVGDSFDIHGYYSFVHNSNKDIQIRNN